MRQYEYKHCIEKKVKEGQILDVGFANVITGFCETDLTIVFANPQTNNVICVPYGSEVKIEDSVYKVIQGEVFQGRNGISFSSNCLMDEKSNLHNLGDYRGKQAIFLR